MRKSKLQDELRTPGCHFVDASSFYFDKTATDAQKANAITKTNDQVSGLAGDALLYLGRAASLTQSPISPDLYLDADFRKEISRRFLIIIGEPLKTPTAANNPMSPRYVRAYGGMNSNAK